MNLKNSYRGNSKALNILNSLDLVAKRFDGELPISFYIADCDIATLRQILARLGYKHPKLQKKITGASFAVMVRPRG